MEPILALAISLPAPGSRHLLRDLHRQLQGAIIDGRLRAGSRLPATRRLAEALGISRNTTVAAYDLLLSEGYLVARPGAGTYVTDVLPRRPLYSAAVPPAAAKAGQRATAASARPATSPDPRLRSFWQVDPPIFDVSRTQPVRYDFRLGIPDRTQFPHHIWRRLSTRSLQRFARVPVGYADAAGSPALREAIARHVSFTRAVACSADDIIVTAGAQQAFDLLARVLVTGRTGDRRATTVAVELPGYPPLRNTFAAAGAHLVGVPVDAEGLVVAAVPKAARIICVTPSHQFPLGAVLSLRRRSALLALAQAQNAVVIEDDYDGEFRFAGQPLDALQTLDRQGVVFYVGTFSKSLFPELRLGYVVAPGWARQALLSAKQLSDWHAPVLVQETLAAFIADGHLVRYVRKMRRLYAARRDQLLHSLARHCGEALQPVPSMAGLHLAARLTPSAKLSPLTKGRTSEPADQRISAAARPLGLRIDYAGRYDIAAPGQRDVADAGHLVFGYGQIEAADIDPAIKRLARLL